MRRSRKPYLKKTEPPTFHNPEFADCLGKETLFRLVWRDWKKELPKSGRFIFAVVRANDGWFPVTGEYIEERIKNHLFRRVRFHLFPLPDIFLGDENEPRLIAWAYAKFIKPTLRLASEEKR